MRRNDEFWRGVQAAHLGWGVLLGVGVLAWNFFGWGPSEARIFTNTDMHTPMNHGQKSIEVTLPAGVTFASFGNCSPHWQSPDLAQLKPVWRSFTCNIEKWDAAANGYAPVAPGNVWIEITRGG